MKEYLMVSEVDKAYLAGLIDGEGHIAINLRSGQWSGHQVVLKITNTNLQALGIIEKKFGGTLRPERNRSNRKTHVQWKPVADLAWSTDSAVEILKKVQPYLVIKAEQCNVALEFALTIRSANAKARSITREEWDYRESLRMKIRNLNLRSGEKIPEAIPWPASNKGYVCARCGKEFISARKKKYCSDGCRGQSSYQSYLQRNTKNCSYCNKEFSGLPHRLYCSRKCAGAARKIG